MSTRTTDPALNLALRCVSAVRGAYDVKEEVPRKFRTRCRQLIQSIYYSGLAYTLAYIASKAGDAVLNESLASPEPEAIVKQVKGRAEGPEEASYALYGAFLLASLKTMGVPEVANAKTLLDVLKNLNESPTAAVAEEKALRFAEWLKRLAESLFEAEQA
ncbi:MAG: type III-B CRISPR module-associated protein Cmr5 [Thermofilum sp.]|nr:type III-B CRISPR module-associated protein Cmr5 [Thermofilum sp.]